MTDRELDVLVAEKVMGYGSESNCRRTKQRWICQCGNCDPIPNYSTDMIAAWQVVEKMMTLRRFDTPPEYEHDSMAFHVQVKAWRSSSGWGWSCETNNTWVACSDTAPQAICLCALKAVGIILNEEKVK